MWILWMMLAELVVELEELGLMKNSIPLAVKVPGKTGSCSLSPVAPSCSVGGRSTLHQDVVQSQRHTASSLGSESKCTGWRPSMPCTYKSIKPETKISWPSPAKVMTVGHSVRALAIRLQRLQGSSMTRRFGAEEPAKVPAKGQGEGTLSQTLYILYIWDIYIYIYVYIYMYNQP